MRRALFLSIFLAALTVAATLLPSPPLGADSCYECPAPSALSRGSATCTTCETAEADAISDAYSRANCWAAGVCAYGSAQVTTPCWFDGALWHAEATVEYACWQYICP